MNFYFTYIELKSEGNEKEKEIIVKKNFTGVQLIVEKAHNKFITRLKNLHFFLSRFEKTFRNIEKEIRYLRKFEGGRN